MDANAFYSYYGRSKLGMNSEPVDPRALGQFLDKCKAKSLPTSAFIEIIVHFRDYPQVVRNFLRFITDKHISWGCGQNPGHFDTVKDYGVTLFQRAGSCRTHVV